jgi:hypothetical protein
VSDTEYWLELFAELESVFGAVASGSSRERNLIGRIRNGLLQIISAVRDGYVPDFARATAPLTSLAHHIHRGGAEGLAGVA